MQTFATFQTDHPHQQHAQQQQQQQARLLHAAPSKIGKGVTLTEDQYLNASLALMADLKSRMCARAAGTQFGHRRV